MLADLHDRLLPGEQEHREAAFSEARDFIARVSREGGVHAARAAVQKSFPVKPRPDKRRVDIEVHKGTAFVPESVSSALSTTVEL